MTCINVLVPSSECGSELGQRMDMLADASYADRPESADAEIPLVVDLDGTLVRSDLLVESAFAYLGVNPFRIFSLPGLMLQGKAGLKDGIAAKTAIDATHLPYDERVLALIEEARREGRKIYIASASNERYVAAVGAHVGANGWFASNTSVNLSGETKARRLVEAFGERGFDYAGNDHADLPVWAVCNKVWVVNPSRGVRNALATSGADVAIVESQGGRAKAWIKLVRVHQWAKNALVFVPLLTAHKFGRGSFLEAFGAFLAFSTAASAVYIVNDLVDLDADRKPPSKKRRPLAAGTVPILTAFPVALGLLAMTFALALFIAPLFLIGLIMMGAA
jgi:hypothetical protein